MSFKDDLKNVLGVHALERPDGSVIISRIDYDLSKPGPHLNVSMCFVFHENGSLRAINTVDHANHTSHWTFAK